MKNRIKITSSIGALYINASVAGGANEFGTSPRFADRDLFMRYQHGMSVGHTYMHSKDSPAPTPIPSIPSDFDHCLDFRINPTEDLEGNGQGDLGAYGLAEVEDSDLAAFQDDE